MTVSSTPAAPPKELKASGRKLWTAALADYTFDVHEELLLLQACRCADRLDWLAVAAGSEVTVVSGKGETAAHPAVVESRQQSLTLARLLASLRMPSGEEGGQLQRPQRRGAARGSYGVRAVS